MKFGIRELVFLVLMLGFLAASWLVVFRRSNEKVAGWKAEDDAKLKAMVDLRQSTVGVADLGHKIDELQKAIAFFESKLPQEKEIDKILKEVWQMAEANSLQTKTIKTLRSEPAGGYYEQPIQMSLNGDFRGFYSFLLQLEKLPRITRVHQLSLRTNGVDDKQLQAQMTLSIFFEPEGGGPKVASARN